MRVFVTGATGFIGSAVVTQLGQRGHEVLGLARSDTSAAALRSLGVDVHRGNLEDLDSLQAGARLADAVVHTAFNHDFSQYVQNTVADGRVVEAIAQALEGSGKPFVAASATTVRSDGQHVTETDTANPSEVPRMHSEAALAWADRGLRPSVVRLPPTVHGPGDAAFVPTLIELARKTGVAAYIGAGENRWPAVHRLDAAGLFVLALEHAEPGARLHAVAEQGIPMRHIAQVIAQGLGVPTKSLDPEDAQAHFGWLTMFAGLDAPALSTSTRAQTGWTPEHDGLLEDMRQHYFQDSCQASE